VKKKKNESGLEKKHVFSQIWYRLMKKPGLFILNQVITKIKNHVPKENVDDCLKMSIL
jgi:arylamine N-acetyltransferase